MAHPTRPPPLSAQDRRRRRIERQLQALRVMQGHFTTRDIVWAALTIPGIALLFLLVAVKLHWLSGSAPLALAGVVVAAVVVWLIGRRWVAVAWLIVIALICLLFEDIPTFGDWGDSGAKPKREKMDRREKLKLAITRREALLRDMDRAAPRGGPAP
jgi:hypothetical protein